MLPYKDKAQQREFQRIWIAKRRADYFANKTCVRCGSVEDLELDHIDRKTKVSNSIWSWSAYRRNAELAKCQILCLQCHKNKTKEFNDKGHIGIDNSMSKLNDWKIQEIRDLHASGNYSSRELAKLFGVDEKGIRLIIARKTWSHV